MVEGQVPAVEGTCLHLGVCHFSVWLLRSRAKIAIENILGQFIENNMTFGVSVSLGARALQPGL